MWIEAWLSLQHRRRAYREGQRPNDTWVSVQYDIFSSVSSPKHTICNMLWHTTAFSSQRKVRYATTVVILINCTLTKRDQLLAAQDS